MKQDTEIIISKTNKNTCQASRNYNEIYFLSVSDSQDRAERAIDHFLNLDL